MRFLDVFRPAPHVEEIQDPEIVKKNYKYWRLRTFYSIYIGYVFFYFTRKSFTFAIPAMQTELGLGKFELGLLASIMSLTYGASKFLSGMMGDKANPRYFMSIGLILTGVFNLLFGLSSVFWVLALFWGVNGWFQGWGAPVCAKILTHWYSQSERARWWSVWNTSHNLGGTLIPLLIAACVSYYGWRFAMFVPGFLCIGIGFFLMNRLRDTPQSLGLPPIEKFRNDYPSEKGSKESNTMTAKEILWRYVLSNKYIWVLGISFFFIYIIRTAINDWSMLYLIEMKEYSNLEAGVCVCCFDLGGLFGSLAAGWTSDLIFKAKRNPVSILFTVGILLMILVFRSVVFHWVWVDVVFIFFFGFFIFGPQMLIGMAAVELSHKKAAATATGFVGSFAYLGAAVAGGPLGAVIKEWGWDAYLMILMGCGIACCLLLLPFWSLKTDPRTASPVSANPEPQPS